MRIFYRGELKKKRRDLRSNSTFVEILLWEQLKKKQFFNTRWRRQASIGHFIADFYCPSEKLVIELDGAEHLENILYDQRRSQYLQRKGLTVIRFDNHDIIYEMDSVLKIIAINFKNKE